MWFTNVRWWYLPELVWFKDISLVVKPNQLIISMMLCTNGFANYCVCNNYADNTPGKRMIKTIHVLKMNLFISPNADSFKMYCYHLIYVIAPGPFKT